MDLSHLDEAVQFFSEKGVAASTQSVYQASLRKFSYFCSLFNIVSPFPVSESILCYFASYLATIHLSPQTIKTYLAGIRHTQIRLGLPEPKEFSSLSRLKLIQAGITRVHALAPPSQRQTRIRLPITPAILHGIHKLWSPRAADPDVVMLWAAATLCFFGFFRAGEITVPSLTSWDRSKHLCWGDVAIDSIQSPSLIRVSLRQSKTDQLRKGVDVFVGKTGCPLCPVIGVVAYMAARGNQTGPFFQLQNGTPLTKAHFTTRIRSALQELGLPYNDFAGHSFRIGAATAAAKAGMEDSTIRAMGRWNSSAFLTYVRTPREQLATLSVNLART